MNYLGYSISKPKLVMVTQPLSQYKSIDTISFTVSSPNYSKKVQYRVILYNSSTKQTTNLWQTKSSGYYYTGWMPAGNYKFTINWPVLDMKPGLYSLTVLVKRAGAKTAYDSYVKTRAFYVVNDNTDSIVNPVIENNTETSGIINEKVLASGDGYLVLKNGSLWAQGENPQGQLGTVSLDGTKYNPRSLTAISFDDDWTDIATGALTIGLKKDGSLWGWGCNQYGILGTEPLEHNTYEVDTPVLISNDGGWSQISAGSYHIASIKSDGSLWTLGCNNHGQLGDGTTVNKSSFTRVGSDNDWIKVYAGDYYTLAVKNDGTLWGFGELSYALPTVTSPTQLGCDNDWIDVRNDVALKKDGTLWSWGSASYYYYNDIVEYYNNALNIVKVNDSNWKVINDSGTIGIKEDGTLWRIGTGGTPSQLGNDSNWTGVAHGPGCNIAYKSDGTVWKIGPSQYIYQANNIGINDIVQLTSFSSIKPNTFPTIQWGKSYGTTANESAFAVNTTNDGGIITAGIAYYTIKGSNIYLIKTDAAGKRLFTKLFGTKYMDIPYSVQQTKDGGYIVAGTTLRDNYGDTCIYLIKTDKNGNKLWEKSYKRNYRTFGYSLQQTADGGYMVTGKTMDPNMNEYVLYLVKFDASGNKKWDKYIKSISYNGLDIEFNNIEGHVIKQTKDGNFIILANCTTYNDIISSIFEESNYNKNIISLIKIDPNGNILWRQSYGLDNVAYSVEENSDGSFIISGMSIKPDPYYPGSLLMKTDAKGNMLWKRNIICTKYSLNYICFGAVQSSDGGYVTTGYCFDIYGVVSNRINKKAFVVKTDENGYYEYGKLLKGAGTAEAYSIVKAKDGYIIAGETKVNDTGTSNFYLVKIKN